MNIILAPMPNLNIDGELSWQKSECNEVLSDYIWYQASQKFAVSRLDCAITAGCAHNHMRSPRNISRIDNYDNIYHILIKTMNKG